MLFAELTEILKQSVWGEALITFAVAMLPVFELRGAIPLGVSLGLHPWASMTVSVIGNMVPTPFIILFIRRFFRFLCRKSRKISGFVMKLETRAEGKWERIRKYEFIGLILLVAVPLPGTGAWTGSLIAAIANLRMRRALPAILIGVLIAGFIVTGMTFGFIAIL